MSACHYVQPGDFFFIHIISLSRKFQAVAFPLSLMNIDHHQKCVWHCLKLLLEALFPTPRASPEYITVKKVSSTENLTVVQTPSETLSPAVYGDKQKDPQPDLEQSVRDLGPCSHKWGVSVKSLPLGAPGILQKRRQRVSPSQKRWSASGRRPLNQHEQSSHELTETEVACSGPAQVCTGHAQVLCMYTMTSSLVLL